MTERRFGLLSVLIEIAAANNTLVTSILDDLREAAVVGKTNIVINDEATLGLYRKDRQTVLDCLGYFGYEVVERKEFIEGKPLHYPKRITSLVIKPTRSLVSGREINE